MTEEEQGEGGKEPKQAVRKDLPFAALRQIDLSAASLFKLPQSRGLDHTGSPNNTQISHV